MATSQGSSTPYVVSVLVAALGWLVATVSAELQTTPAISYTTSYKDGAYVLLVENISAQRALSNIHLSLACSGETQGCFSANKTGAVIASPIAIAPTAQPHMNAPISTTKDVSFYITLPPGGAFALKVPAASPAAQTPILYNMPDTADSVALRVRQPSISSFFIQHYYEILLTLFLTGALAFGAWLLSRLVATAKAQLRRSARIRRRLASAGRQPTHIEPTKTLVEQRP